MTPDASKRDVWASRVRLYASVVALGYRKHAAYFGATWAGVFTNSVFGFMRAYVLLALYQQTRRVGGFDVTDAMTYTFVTQGMIMIVHLWGWNDIALRVKSGDIVTDLYRPIGFQSYWLAQDIGRATYHAIFRGIPPFLIGALAFHVRLPRSPFTWVAFTASCALAATVSFAVRYMVNLSTFWLLDDRGVNRLHGAITTFFSGFVIPVTFFPGALRTVAQVLPFAALVQVPVEVFLEKPGVVGKLAFQLVWAVVLLALGRAVLAAATRKLVVQGG